VRPLGYYHPLQVALEANTTDQLTGGRYMLGIGTGFYPKKLEWRGLDPNSMRAVMEPSIELMLKLWNSKEPVDYDGPFWKGKKMLLECPPVQKPHPPVGIAAANTVGSVELAGRLGLMVLTGDFIPIPRLRLFADTLVKAQTAAGRKPRRRDLRTCRVIYVAETDKEAVEDMREVLYRRDRGDRQHAASPGRAHSARRHFAGHHLRLSGRHPQPVHRQPGDRHQAGARILRSGRWLWHAHVPRRARLRDPRERALDGVVHAEVAPKLRRWIRMRPRRSRPNKHDRKWHRFSEKIMLRQ
jgi:alkanesulfonate monooxygenase SsuD/methylene tetrahydromethanopterin reductase-like flavin-dependent oxidoreductase (luciferase family)